MTIKRVNITDLLPPDLALRHNANVLFNIIEAYPEIEIELNFQDVNTITHSFAHEYLIRKEKSSKIIREINLPEKVRKMFEIVVLKMKNPPTMTL